MFAGTPARLRIFSLAAYTHRSLNRNVLEAAAWFASELAKFDSYGAAPGAMPRLGFALGPAHHGHDGLHVPRAGTWRWFCGLFR